MSSQKCQAANCKSKCRKTVKFFNFPSDIERRKLWVEVCERDLNWFPTSRNQKLCQIHFDDEQFEKRRVDGWRKLKWNAVPTIKTSTVTRLDTATIKLEEPTYGIKTEPLYQGYEERLMTSAAPDPPNEIVRAPEPSCQICGRPSELFLNNLCRVCKKKFEFDQELNIQKKKNVRTVVKYQCDECLKNFSNINMYHRHIKCHDEKKPYRCVCQKRFYHSRDLVLHMETHESVECELENDVYKPIAVLETVNENENEETPRNTSDGRNFSYVCKHCQKDFMYFGNYAKHLEQHSIGKLMCKFCSQMFGSTYQIRKHIRDYHSNQEMFDCSVCFTTLPKHCFVSHMRTHRSDDKTLMCKYCGCQFCEPIELFHHFKNEHSESTELTASVNNSRDEKSESIQQEITETANGYKCKYCGMIFDDVLKMYHHVKVHIKNTSTTKRLVQVTNIN